MIVVTFDPVIGLGQRCKVTVEQVSLHGVRRELAVTHIPATVERMGSRRVNASTAIVEALRRLPSILDQAP